jgi:8-oxo-dGTP pyrophosphatase MutT (NUDIX family)
MAGPMLTGNEVEPLPAASVIVLRDDPFEVLMLRRTESASFVPNAWVFPGGITEPLDLELGGMHVTGARETFEETGVWLGAPLDDAEQKRKRLLAGNLSFRHILAEAPLDEDKLVLTSRWITPVGLPKRFDTYFYLSRVSRDVVASPERNEAVEVLWLHPARALERHAAREMQMVFPTLRNLEALAGFDDANALIAARRGADIEPVLPVLVDGKPTLP